MQSPIQTPAKNINTIIESNNMLYMVYPVDKLLNVRFWLRVTIPLTGSTNFDFVIRKTSSLCSVIS
jgi:hypothetical protein